MPRAYGHKFLLALKDADPGRLGVRLARVCVDANIPAAYVAEILQVARMTVYSWFRGGGIREDKRSAVEALLKILEDDLASGRLPVSSLQSAKFYVEDIAGVKL